MTKKESEMLLKYMQSHFEEIETLLKMGLVQNLSDKLGDGISDLQPPKTEKLIMQVDGEEWDISDCRDIVIKNFVSSGHTIHTIESLSIYLKPRDHKAYYVVNEKYRGSVDLPRQS